MLLWCNEPIITCLFRAIFGINHLRDFWKIWNFKILKNALGQFIPNHPPKYSQRLLVLIIQLSNPKLNNRILVKLGTDEVENLVETYIIYHKIPNQLISHYIPNTKGFYYRVTRIVALKHKTIQILSNSKCQRNLIQNFQSYFRNIKTKKHLIGNKKWYSWFFFSLNWAKWCNTWLLWAVCLKPRFAGHRT